MKQTARAVALAGLMITAPAVASGAGGPFDGTVPLLCAPTEVQECGTGTDCQRRTIEAVNLPPFIAIDFKGQSLSTADGRTRTAPIQRVERVDGRLILQGGQEGRAWSVVIAGDTGKLSAGVVDEHGAFVMFGSCTAR